MIDFGRRLSEIRKGFKLTQSQFAELVHLSEDSIGKLERGVSQPTLDTLMKISVGLKMPISELIGEKPVPKTQNRALEELISYLRTKSEKDIKLLHRIGLLILERKK